MLGASSMVRISLGDNPSILPALNAGIEAWGHPGIERYSDPSSLLNLANEIVTEAAAKWYEVGFLSPELLDGNAQTGWIYRSGRVHVWLEWSDDLIHWSTGKYVDAPGSPEVIKGGILYSARSIYSQDSVVKTGHMWCESSSVYGGDTRNNPFTSLTLNNVVQSLPNFPYTMPTGAAQMQTDLRALGWTDVTVVATSDIDWKIEIPGVNFTAYSTKNFVGWPDYLVPDYFGNLVNHCNGFNFTGDFVDPNGLRCTLNKQFARLGIRRF